MYRFLVWTLLVACLWVGGVHTATADSVDDPSHVEVYYGQYDPQEINKDATFGIRGGHTFGDGWAWEGSLGRFETTETFPSQFRSTTSAGIEALFLDLSVLYDFHPERRAVVYLYGGPGYVDAEAKVGGSSAGASSLTLHAGFGLKVKLTDRIYLRPDFRSRWFEDCTEKCVEPEGTLALGFKF